MTERYKCYRCTMSFRVGWPVLKCADTYSRCSDCDLRFWSVHAPPGSLWDAPPDTIVVGVNPKDLPGYRDSAPDVDFSREAAE